MPGGYDGTIRIDSKIDGRGFNAGIRSMIGALRTLAAAVGLAFGIGAIVTFGRTAVDAAKQMSDAMTGLQSVLQSQGRSFSEAKSFVDDYISDGLVPAINAIAAYQALAARGYDTGQIETLMTVMKDAAAFNRQAHFDMGTAIQRSAEGLRMENSLLTDSVGIQTNVAKMWEAYAKQIGTTTANLTLAQKRQAEVNGFMREGELFMGNAAKAAGSYSGKAAALSASFLNLRVAIGNTLLPVLSRIIPYIRAVIDWLTRLFNTWAMLVQAFFGVDATATMAAQEQAMSRAADSAQDAAGAAGDLAKNTEKAGRAAKGALAAFDDLNVLAQDTGGGADAGLPDVGGGAGAPAIEPPEITIPDDTLEKVEAFKQRLLELIAPVSEAFGKLRESLESLGQTIWEGLKWAWDNILVPLGEWVITDALPVFLELLAAGAEVLNEALIALQPMGQWLWENFLQPLAEWTGGAIVDVLGWLADRLNDISDWISTNQKTVETIAIIVGSFAAAWWLVNAAITAWTVIAGVAAGVTAAFGAAVAFLTSPVFLVILAIGALIAIIVLLVKNWDWVQETAGNVWDWIKQKWSEAGGWFNRNVTEPIKKWFEQAWANIKTAATNAWNWLVSVWTGAGEWFRTNVTEPIKDAFKTALDWVEEKWKSVFTGVKNFVRDRINEIIDFINSMISAIAGGLNTVIGGLNGISVKVPSWVPVYGGQSFGFSLPQVNTPQIPRLATGAVIPGGAPFMAILGDQPAGKTNIEAPADLIRQIVREELEGAEGGDVVADISLNLDGEVIYRSQRRIERRRGRSLISGGAAA